MAGGIVRTDVGLDFDNATGGAAAHAAHLADQNVP
jgi:hypothetical protein